MRGRLLMIPQVTISHGEHEEIETGTKRERAMADGGCSNVGVKIWLSTRYFACLGCEL